MICLPCAYLYETLRRLVVGGCGRCLAMKHLEYILSPLPSSKGGHFPLSIWLSEADSGFTSQEQNFLSQLSFSLGSPAPIPLAREIL